MEKRSIEMLNKKENRKIVSTPVFWYIIGCCVLTALLFLWILFYILNNNCDKDFSSYIDFFKNLFFAIIGSLIVAFLIDIGNTSRDKKLEVQALGELKKLIADVYDKLSVTVFLFENGFRFEKNGKIKLINFYNHEFCFERNKKVIEYMGLEKLGLFKKDIKEILQKIMTSTYFVKLDSGIRANIEELFLNEFSLLTNLNEYLLSIATIPDMPKEIAHLKIIKDEMGKTIDKNNTFRFLTEKESIEYQNRRAVMQKETNKYFEQMQINTKNHSIYKGNQKL